MPRRPEEYGYFTDDELKAARQNSGPAKAPYKGAGSRSASGVRYTERGQDVRRTVPNPAQNTNRVPQSIPHPSTRSAQPAKRQTPPSRPSAPARKDAPQQGNRNAVRIDSGRAPVYKNVPQTVRNQDVQNRKPVLNDRQKALYERAYYEKYGRSPYVGSAGAGTRVFQNSSASQMKQDRRQAFLADERERRIKEAAERRRAEENRLRAEAEAARAAAAREAKRRSELEHELAAKRRERENLRRYEIEKKRLEDRRRAEAEARRRANEKRREKIRRRRHRIRSFKFHLKVFAAAVFVFAALAVYVAFRSFYADGSDPSRGVSYYFDGEKAYTAPEDTAYEDGVICLDFTDLAERFGFYISGDSTSLKFIIPDADGEEADTVEFFVGSRTALINGTPVTLEAESRYTDSSLWVPCSVVDYFEGGLKTEKLSRGRIELSRVRLLDENEKYLRDKDGNYVYEDFSLYYKPMIANDKVDLVALYGDDAKGLGKGSKVAFKSDLSQYEEYMNPSDSNEFLILVNNDNPLDVSYIPDDLTAVTDTRADGRAQQRMRMTPEKALEAMFIEMRAEGYTDVSVTGGFVSYSEQANLFASYVNREMADGGLTESEAKAAVLKYCDDAGTSDFQTGLSAVMHNLDESSAEFASTPAYTWLAENSWKFGYVVRYPSEKNDITGHSFDPCHFRYVGRFAAEIIHNNGWCLEEYLISGTTKR